MKTIAKFLAIMTFTLVVVGCPSPVEPSNQNTGGNTGGNTNGPLSANLPAKYYVLNADEQSYSVANVGNNVSGDIVIASTHGGLPVTGIADEAFEQTFWGNVNITSITMPESIITIGERAFYKCTGLTSITIPENVTIIDDQAFYSCDKLTTITIPNGVQTIGEKTFAFTSKLERITISESVTQIGNDAFLFCKKLENIEVNEHSTTFKSINGNLYSKDEKKLIRYASGKVETTFSIPNTVEIIGDSAFEEDATLQEVIIPVSVKTIENSAFNSTNIHTISIPNSVVTIGEEAFYGCSNLLNISISESVSSIGKQAFNFCTKLDTITVDDGSQNYKAVDNVLYTKDGSTLIKYAPKKTDTSFTFPTEVTTIKEYAFMYSENLLAVIIPAEVTSIGNSAFYECDNLTITAETVKSAVPDYDYSTEKGWHSGWNVKDFRDDIPVIWPVVPTVIVNFNALEGIVDPTSIEVEEGGKPSHLPTPEKTGFTFEGWFTDNGTFASEFTTNTTVSADITVYAKWEAKPIVTYTVTFNNHYGTLAEEHKTKEVVENTAVGELPIPVRDNYRFLGWGYYKNGTKIPFTEDTIITGDLTASDSYDRWERISYVVTFDANGGTVDPESKTVTVETAIGEIPTPEKPGFTFVEWTYYDSGSKVLSADTIINDDFTVLAKWDQKTYTVTFITNGGYDIEPRTVYGGNTITSLSDAMQNDHVFLGWYTDEGLTAEFVETTSITENIKLYAKWRDATVGIVYGEYDTHSYVADNTGFNGSEAIIASSYNGKPVKTFHYTISFENVSPLTKVFIPKDIYSITVNPFAGCSNLSSITIDEDNTDYKVIDNSIYSLDGEYLISANPTATTFSVPNHVNSIWSSAFNGNTHLEMVSIPEGVTYIGNRSFSGCTSLTKLILPSTVNEIQNGAFEGCTALQSINIPEGVTIIKESTFEECISLETIVLPPDVTAIEKKAFLNCSSLESVNIPAGVKDIEESTFEGCTNLHTVTMSAESKLDRIDAYAFLNCSSLKNITIPSTVDTIGLSAFSGCASLEKLVLPNSIRNMNSYVFKNCTNLKDINIPTGLFSIPSDTFLNCSSLDNIVIPSEIYAISRSSFEGCTSLQNVIIESGVQEIEGSAFKGCTSLKELIIPNTVKYIRIAAFDGCDNLTVTAQFSEKPLGWDDSWNANLGVFPGTTTFKPDIKVTWDPDVVLPTS